jgi:hypothetical protein
LASEEMTMVFSVMLETGILPLERLFTSQLLAWILSFFETMLQTHVSQEGATPIFPRVHGLAASFFTQ